MQSNQRKKKVCRELVLKPGNFEEIFGCIEINFTIYFLQPSNSYSR